jgi:hypothetical protein
LVDLRNETKAVIALLEAGAHWSVKRGQFHGAILRNIEGKLKQRNPRIRAEAAEDMAVVLLQNMKTMVALSAERDGNARAGAIGELREMTRLYLATRCPGMPHRR